MKEVVSAFKKAMNDSLYARLKRAERHHQKDLVADATLTGEARDLYFGAPWVKWHRAMQGKE